MTPHDRTGPSRGGGDEGSGRTNVVWLAASVRAMVYVEAAAKYPNETGGVLLGYTDSATGAIVVTAATGPGPNAVHGPTHFIPDHAYHRSEIARLYAQSGRRYAYLGDWHTHPRTSAYLSAMDADTLERIAAAESARVDRPLMVVLGQPATRAAMGDRNAWYVEAWQYVSPRSRWGRLRSARPGDRHAAKCHVVAFDHNPEH